MDLIGDVLSDSFLDIWWNLAGLVDWLFRVKGLVLIWRICSRAT